MASEGESIDLLGALRIGPIEHLDPVGKGLVGARLWQPPPIPKAPISADFLLSRISRRTGTALQHPGAPLCSRGRAGLA